MGLPILLAVMVHPGDMLVHFPGTPAGHLEGTLGPYLTIVEAHKVEWEVPVQDTEYMREIEEFWRKLLTLPQNV
jgi:hypothetical protein